MHLTGGRLLGQRRWSIVSRMSKGLQLRAQIGVPAELGHAHLPNGRPHHECRTVTLSSTLGSSTTPHPTREFDVFQLFARSVQIRSADVRVHHHSFCTALAFRFSKIMQRDPIEQLPPEMISFTSSSGGVAEKLVNPSTCDPLRNSFAKSLLGVLASSGCEQYSTSPALPCVAAWTEIWLQMRVFVFLLSLSSFRVSCFSLSPPSGVVFFH